MDDYYELRVCRLGHVDGYRRGTIVPPTCIRRSGALPPGHYCESRTRALHDAEVAAYLLGGEEAVAW